MALMQRRQVWAVQVYVGQLELRMKLSGSMLPESGFWPFAVVEDNLPVASALAVLRGERMSSATPQEASHALRKAVEVSYGRPLGVAEKLPDVRVDKQLLEVRMETVVEL